MFLNIGKTGDIELFSKDKSIYLGIVDGVGQVTIEVNDKEARDYNEEKDFHIYFNKKTTDIIIVTPKKQKEMQESDYKDPNLVYIGH